jgi:hypothetical protein
MRRVDPLKLVDTWNTNNRVGVAVLVTLDDGAQRETKTRSEAFVLEGHSAVIMLEGVTGCYCLERVKAKITGSTCAPKNFPDGARECRACGAFAAGGEELICRKTGQPAQ